MSEDTKVRSQSPELESMLLPQLQAVASQLGIEGAAKMKKAALVTAISELQAQNRESAKAEREAARAERDARRAERRGDRNDRNDRGDRNDGGDDNDQIGRAHV